jgi:hypothetical protein
MSSSSEKSYTFLNFGEGETRIENKSRFYASQHEPAPVHIEHRLGTGRSQVPKDEQPKQKIPSGIHDDFSWISFIGHAMWRGPVVSALISAAYMLWVWGGSAAYATEAALALSAFPFLPVAAIIGFAVGLLWAWSESASGD